MLQAVQRHVYFRTPRRSNREAPLFVFLPGMDGTGDLLRVQTDGLGRTFDLRCLAIPPDDLTTWHDLTEQTVALIRAELEGNSERPVYLCGESFGGCLAIKVALRAPQLFQRLVLINPASSFHRRPWIHWSAEVTKLLPDSLYQLSCIALMPFLASLERISTADRVALLDAMQSVTQASSIWRIALLRDFQVSAAQLRRITQPVLIVASAGDRLLPSVHEAQLLTNALPRAFMHILPNSGHACLLEADVNLYEIMRNSHFLDLAAQKVSFAAPSGEWPATSNPHSALATVIPGISKNH